MSSKTYFNTHLKRNSVAPQNQSSKVTMKTQTTDAITVQRIGPTITSGMSSLVGNYQNVDLFKIPDLKITNFSKRANSLRNEWIQSQSENTSRINSQFQSFDNTPRDKEIIDVDIEVQPDKILQEAIDEVKINRQLKKKFGKTMFDKFQASQNQFSTTSHGIDEIENFFKFPQNLETQKYKTNNNNTANTSVDEEYKPEEERKEYNQIYTKTADNQFTKTSGSFIANQIIVNKDMV